MSSTNASVRSRRALATFALAAIAAAAPLSASITIALGGGVSFPAAEVIAEPQQIVSAGNFLALANDGEPSGWTLICEIAESRVEGLAKGASIPARARFVSIRWIAGGSGSTAGIYIAPDGSRIEAAPGFGEGSYEVEYEVSLDAPAFLSADAYSGVISFSIQ